MSKWKQYETDLEKWEKERERQLEEFTCTENDIDADLRLPETEVSDLDSVFLCLFFLSVTFC